MSQLTRRTFLRGLSATVLGSLAFGTTSCEAPGTSGDGAAAIPLSIGYLPIACATPLVLADAAGIFARHGVNVQLKKYAGWADLWSAYANGELDVAHMLSPMALAIDAGVTHGSRPTELSFSLNTNGNAIVLANDLHPHTRQPSDLKGTVMAIPFEYSIHAMLLRDWLAAGGVDPVRDLELRLLRPADMVAQLEVGGIDGFIVAEPFNQRALQIGAGRIFTATREHWDRHPCCSLAIAKQWRGEHPDRAEALVAALDEASAFANDQGRHREVVDILAQEKYLNQPASLISPVLAGKYLDWDGEQISDPDYMSFGDSTSFTAMTWMAAQIARWDLSSASPLPLNDAAITAAARSVLPAGVPVDGGPVMINGQLFDPAHPTRNYARN